MNLAIFAALALTAAPDGGMEPLAAALQRTLDAHGGLAALSRVKALTQKGTVASTARKGVSGSVLRVFERPRRLRVEVAFPNEAPEVRVLDGAKGWREGMPVSPDDPKHLAMVLQALRLQLPLVLYEGRDKLVDGGLVTRGDLTLRAIVLPVEPGLTITAEVDPATGRIVRSVGHADAGKTLLEFVTVYADYRTVSGVLAAFKEENFAMGTKTGDTTLESLQLVPSAPAGSFRP